MATIQFQTILDIFNSTFSFFPYFICTDYNAKQRSALHGMRRDAIQYNAMHYSTIHEKDVMQCDQCNS